MMDFRTDESINGYYKGGENLYSDIENIMILPKYHVKTLKQVPCVRRLSICLSAKHTDRINKQGLNLT